MSEAEKAIDELFKRANQEHEMVVKLYEESQKYHEKYIKLVHEVATLINEIK